MRIHSYIGFILACFLMQSCASSINTQRLEAGKTSFMAGDFKSAFHQLLPLAAEGVPQAEYGVGYMYYYGYGVTQDTESGIFWMNRAAAAHYAPAIKALAAIEENNIKEAEKRKSRNVSATPKINNIHAENTPVTKELSEDVILEALNKTPPAAPQEHVTAMSQAETTPKAEPVMLKKMSDQIAAVTRPATDFDSKKYTLQILGSYYLSSLKARQAELNLGVPTYIGQTKHNGRDWYILTVGHYPALGNAELAKLDLPKKIKDFNPWIRKCDNLSWVG